MPVHDDLGIRMKTFYEEIPKTRLMRRTPVAIRLDGKSFHTFTRGFAKPFDEVLIKSMQQTTKYLCENIQGCVLGYTQSDEITLILVDYKRLASSAWFDNEVQKMCSISASMATMAFNKYFRDAVTEFEFANRDKIKIDSEEGRLDSRYRKAIDLGAMFDSRCFNIPKEEVTNLIYWRQLDASRNSIQMVGQANFSHKELLNKSCNEIQDMLMLQKGINWNNLPVYQKRGCCCIRRINNIPYDGLADKEIDKATNKETNKKTDMKKDEFRNWIIDTNIPIFRGEGRDYIDSLINVGEE